MDYHIVKISRNKKQYLDLLLLGDEQEIMIDRYLERGDLFVLEDNGIKAVCVVTKEGPKINKLPDKPLLKRIYSDDSGNRRRSRCSCIL